jgi:GNAT superfamily N-acetyltransferase
VNIRPFDEGDYARMADIVAAIDTDRYRPPEWYRQRDESRTAAMLGLRLVAERDGVPVGWGDIGHSWWAFHPRKFSMRLNVDPTAQGQGIGTALFSHLIEHAESTWNPLRIGIETRENRPGSARFLEHRGFSLWRRRVEGHLWLRDGRLERADSAEQRLSSTGVSVVTIAEYAAARGRERLERDLFDLERQAQRDEPDYDPDGAMQFDQFVANELDPASLLDSGSFLALVGDELVGVSRLSRDLSVAGVLHVGFTGVHPDYRGRGIALALKLRTVAFARAQGFEEIRTQNDAENLPMLHINEALGFTPKPAWLAYAKTY